MKTEREEERELALTGARSIAGVVFATSVVAIAGWYSKGFPLPIQWWVSAAVSLLLGGVALGASRMRAAFSGLITLSCLGVLFLASGISIFWASEAHFRIEPFMAYKGAALIFAILPVRPRWAGYLGISLCGAFPMVLYFTVFSPFRGEMPVQEPWMSALIAAISFWLYRSRIASARLERELARARAEEEAAARLATAVLSFRDLSNTPLQTLTATTALLRDERVSREEIARMNEAALLKLRELTRTLEAYESQIDWVSLGGSFDAMDVLKRTLESGRAGES